MTDFTDRIKDADKLETSFIESFNKLYLKPQYKIIKYGIESTKLGTVHEFK